jgi:hypothetical protein
VLLREDKITTFKELYWKIKTQGYREMMSMQEQDPKSQEGRSSDPGTSADSSKIKQF